MLFRVPSQVYGTIGGAALPRVVRLTTGQVAVAAPTLIAAADASRAQIRVKVNGGNSCAVGGPGVASGTGYILDATALPTQPSEVVLSFTGEIWAAPIAGKVVVSFADEGY